MTLEHYLPVEARVTVEVTEHHPWGFMVRVVGEKEIIGSVDAVSASDIRPFNSSADLPAIGEQLEAVVLSYPPSGKLRLSIRRVDLDARTS